MFWMQFPTETLVVIQLMAANLDRRLAWRLAPLLLGVLFAKDRRTVSSWLRAAGLSDDYQDFYHFLNSVGKAARWMGLDLLLAAVMPLLPERVILAIDDTPTKRYGPKVQGAGIHRHPTPSPAGEKYLYGHVWVVLAVLVSHPHWGLIALPLLAELYIREIDVAKLPAKYQRAFRTKLEMGVDLAAPVAEFLIARGKQVWVVADGAYAKAPFLRPLIQQGIVVVSRLRCDAKLFDLPVYCGKGRYPKYGKNRIHLAKRANHPEGWQQDVFRLKRRDRKIAYKTFLATWIPTGGTIRVVIYWDVHGWTPLFCTNPEATVEEILRAASDRWAIEEAFHDLKEVHGARQQQTRDLYASIGCFHLILWMHTLVEVWAWNQSHSRLCDRSASPWDDPDRRPSHADRCAALKRSCVAPGFSWVRTLIGTSKKARRILDWALGNAA